MPAAFISSSTKANEALLKTTVWSTAFDGVRVIRDEAAPTFGPRRQRDRLRAPFLLARSVRPRRYAHSGTSVIASNCHVMAMAATASLPIVTTMRKRRSGRFRCFR